MSRRLLAHYVVDGAREWATIETPKGWYVADVYRCNGEGSRRFRRRVQALQRALQDYAEPLMTTSPSET